MKPGILHLTAKVIPVVTMCCFFGFCSKGNGGGNNNPPNTEDTTIKPAVDPPLDATIGFFMNEWEPKTFIVPEYNTVTPVSDIAGTMEADASKVITKITPAVFGHNANIWMTPMITELAFMTHITNLNPHIIRFPAGSGSDAYFWNAMQGVLPADVPVKLLDKDGALKDPGYNYGRTTNNWQANLDQYYSMLQQSGNQGLLTVNYGYARYGASQNPVATAAKYAADWVRYDNGRTKYWEIGNENFGDWEWGYRIDVSKNKDGQPEFLTGKLYAQHFKVFADSMRSAAQEKGHTIYIGAVVLEAPVTEAWQTNTAKTWNSGLMQEIGNAADYYAVHSYFTPYNTNSTAAVILDSAAKVLPGIMAYEKQVLPANGASIKPVALDEWNMFAVGSRQQVSNVSGLFATIVQCEAIKNKFGLAARWDLLNGLANGDDHGLFSAGDEPGVSKWTPRPSFYYMYYLQKCMGDRLVETTSNTSVVKSYASTFSSGQMGVALVNTSTTTQTMQVKWKNFRIGSRYYWYSLQGGTDNGEFSGKVLVNGFGPGGEAGGPASYKTLKANSSVISGSNVKVQVPARGAVFLVMENEK